MTRETNLPEIGRLAFVYFVGERHLMGNTIPPRDEFELAIYFLTFIKDIEGRPIDKTSLAEIRRRGSILLTEAALRMTPEEFEVVFSEMTSGTQDEFLAEAIFSLGGHLIDTSKTLRPSQAELYPLMTPMTQLGEFFLSLGLSISSETDPPDISDLRPCLDSYARKLGMGTPSPQTPDDILESGESIIFHYGDYRFE